MSTEDPGAATLAMRGLVRIGMLVGIASHALLLVGGCLIPFTVGVSSVLMIPSLIGWPFAALVGWRGTRALAKDDPACPWAQAALGTGVAGLVLLLVVGGLLTLSIGTGVVIGEFFPELVTRPHHGH